MVGIKCNGAVIIEIGAGYSDAMKFAAYNFSHFRSLGRMKQPIV